MSCKRELEGLCNLWVGENIENRIVQIMWKYKGINVIGW